MKRSKCVRFNQKINCFAFKINKILSFKSSNYLYLPKQNVFFPRNENMRYVFDIPTPQTLAHLTFFLQLPLMMKVVYEALNTSCQGRIIRTLLQMDAFKLALPFKCTSISDIFFCLFSINLNSSALNHFK